MIAATIRCPRCRRALATTDGARLLIGPAYCDRLVTLHCAAPGCGGRVVWRPQISGVRVVPLPA